MAMRHLWCACTKFQPNPASRRVLSRSQSGNGSRKTTRIIPSVSNNQILKAMRKSFVYAAGLMCLALSITDCQKELVDQTTPASEPNFELFAQPVTTKTANNGLDTKWVAKDAINVFHAEAGSTAYDSDGKFTVKDIETGRFDGTVSKSLSADKSYDWYAFYPYKDKIVSPKNEKTGYCYIGSRSDATQSQTGDNNMLHISGGNYPLYGIAKNVASSDVPSIQMQHLSSVVKIVVTNSTDEALALTDVAFTANENISGQFYISFDSETPKYTDAQYSSKIAKLAVSDVTISPKASATVYFAVKPFTAKTGTTLKLAVNGYEKTLTLKNDITFTAGHIKPLNFDYDTSLKTATFNFADPESLGLTKPAQSGETKIETPIAKDGITLTTANGSVATRIYNSKGSCDLRVYKDGGKLTFSAADGYLIKSISFVGGKTTAISVDSGVYADNVWTGKSQSVTFTATNTLQISSASLVYEKGVVLPSLATPEVLAEVRDVNSVYAFWGEIAGAKDYTVTCGAQSITLAGTEHTFTDLAYSTSYTISVVANPTDASVNAPSAAGTATATTGANPAGTTVTTYQHIFVSKPSIGSVSLSGVTWTLAASNIGNYNSTNYAGVQFGTQNSSGSITLTSSAWSYKEKTKITEVRVWLNAGTGTPTASVNIGGKDAKSDGKVVQKNTKAKSYKDATMLTFTPIDGGDSGIVVIKASSSNAAYICAMEIDCL